MGMRILSFLLLSLSMSCSSVWYDHKVLEVDGLSMGTVWDLSQNALESTLGAPLDTARTDRGMHRMKTRWRTQAQPFRKGERRRGLIELVVSDDEKRSITIRYYIERQYNKTIGDEFNPKEGDWSGAGQDERLEEHLRYRLRLAVAQAQGKRVPEAEGIRIEDSMKADRANRR
jgi:hypothetical protein